MELFRVRLLIPRINVDHVGLHDLCLFIFNGQCIRPFPVDPACIINCKLIHGIIIGIASIIALITIGQGVTGSILDQLSGLGGNRVTVSLTDTRVTPGFTEEDMGRFEELTEGIRAFYQAVADFNAKK